MWNRFKQFPFLPAVILLALNVRLVTSGLTWIGVAAFALALLWFGFEFVRWLTSPPESSTDSGNSRGAPEEEDDALVSLVYFLSEPRSAEEDTIRGCVSSALGVSLDSGDGESEHFVMQLTAPMESSGDDAEITRFLVRIPEGAFAVLFSDRPYIENPTEFAGRTIRDKRLRNAIESHRAWFSVDLMESPDEQVDRATAYQTIGKILRALAGPDCLAIYCPELQRCNEFDLSLLEVLESSNPLSLFEEPTFEPIIEIADGDPRMAEAVEKATSRWPEFVREFESSSPEKRERFIIKAEFREDSAREYMWVAVSAIHLDRIEGILMNDPHELLDVHRGAAVEVTMDRLNDWIYPQPDGSHAGGFTLDVLADEEGED